mmetsp:Transcript_6837/g.10319  ORF Transcript_6837/g.10319 Transcript_6837/m.10319 type:complete len:240 (-) Transcript_6837:1846-2565(-)
MGKSTKKLGKKELDFFSAGRGRTKAPFSLNLTCNSWGLVDGFALEAHIITFDFTKQALLIANTEVSGDILLVELLAAEVGVVVLHEVLAVGGGQGAHGGVTGEHGHGHVGGDALHRVVRDALGFPHRVVVAIPRPVDSVHDVLVQVEDEEEPQQGEAGDAVDLHQELLLRVLPGGLRVHVERKPELAGLDQVVRVLVLVLVDPVAAEVGVVERPAVVPVRGDEQVHQQGEHDVTAGLDG